MLKILLPVDGSPSSIRATRVLVDTLAWYQAMPQIDILAVHLPLPQYGTVGAVVSKDTIARYYADECKTMLEPSVEVLNTAGVKHTVHAATGSIAETIIETADRVGSNMIHMGTRGMTALSNMVMGSVTTRVLHLAHIPVVLIPLTASSITADHRPRDSA